MPSDAEPYDDVPEDPEELRHAEESAGSARAGHKIVVWVLVALILSLIHISEPTRPY
mgnify:CR=1 FL=1